MPLDAPARTRILIGAVAMGLYVVVCSALPCRAQGFKWPEEPKNLKVLPPGTKGAELGQVMRGFTSALGVRCQYCHVGKGDDLTQFDFPSDDKLAKRKARVMIQMVQAINRTYLPELNQLEPPVQDRVEVTCITCHRTNTRPVMLEDVLAQTIKKDGVDAAVAEYHELRKEYYGGFAYDFSQGTLTHLGEQLAGGGDTDAALRILQLELEANGEAASTYFTLGRVQARAGKRDDALKSFQRGLELAPEGWKPFFQRQIDRLQKP